MLNEAGSAAGQTSIENLANILRNNQSGGLTFNLNGTTQQNLARLAGQSGATTPPPAPQPSGSLMGQQGGGVLSNLTSSIPTMPHQFLPGHVIGKAFGVPGLSK